MTTLSLRLPDEVHARLVAVAEAEHISLNAALVQAAEQWIAQRARQAVFTAAVDKVFEEDAALFRRLADT
ncbi:toxin-antitoxin system HicB family antitoxin [Actinocorallia populi]|uniref:toxin-antitoxin system HicB family antitoxin n=1 Tax=Actinocorallia populi TaxID=2079200 RepID=UPI000D097DC4|nr:toxin-antitoxin system HicB family antitoxin [Actinocorallia populi]